MTSLLRPAAERVEIPKPPRPARIGLSSESLSGREPRREGNGKPPSSSHGTPAVRSRPSSVPLRSDLEGLLKAARALARTLTVDDPSGRLLQIALVRGDYTLLDAVVRAAEKHLCSSDIRPDARRKAMAQTVAPRPRARAGHAEGVGHPVRQHRKPRATR